MGGEQSRPTSRTRKVSDCKTTEERVYWIARLMSRGKWHGYESRERLARAWGISESRVRDLAAEAHRVVAFDPADREELRTSLAKTLKRLADKAERTPNGMTGLPDWRAAIEATVQYAKFAGVELDEQSNLPAGPVMRVIVTDDEKPDGGDADGSPR